MAIAFSTLSLVATIATVSGGPVGECLQVGPPDDSSYHCLPVRVGKSQSVVCENKTRQCDDWAKRGECLKNSAYMLNECRLSCDSCVDLHVGETQRVLEIAEANVVLQKMVQTQAYVMKESTRQAKSYPTFLRDCQNKDSLCTLQAVRGECENNKTFMRENCAAACQSCHA